MAENEAPQMQATLGLTGLTMNAMALIAPGAFLWLTFITQASRGQHFALHVDWHRLATLLCLATAVCYAEMAKLYPGTGSSYYFAEQSFLNHEKAWPYARLAKFIVGWGSHLYYWIYLGVMVAVTGEICGYLAGTLWPSFMSAANPGPMFMMAAPSCSRSPWPTSLSRGVTGSTAVNIAINVIQISALVVFSVMALSYRINHPPGASPSSSIRMSGDSYTYQFATEKQTVNGASHRRDCARRQRHPQASAGRGRQAGALSTSPIPSTTTKATS